MPETNALAYFYGEKSFCEIDIRFPAVFVEHLFIKVENKETAASSTSRKKASFVDASLNPPSDLSLKWCFVVPSIGHFIDWLFHQRVGSSASHFLEGIRQSFPQVVLL